MDMNTEITIRNGHNRVVLDLEEAEKLYLELKKLFEVEKEIELVPYHIPSQPIQHYPQQTWRDNTTITQPYVNDVIINCDFDDRYNTTTTSYCIEI